MSLLNINSCVFYIFYLKGPVIPRPIATPNEMKKLNPNPDIAKETKGTLEAITMTRKKLEGRVPLFGFTGAPVF